MAALTRIYHGTVCAGRGRAKVRLLRYCRGAWVTLAAAFVCFLPATGAAQTSNWVKTGVTGRLIYVPAADGDRLQDVSLVGNGAAKSPPTATLPLMATINATLPAGSDYTTLIQNTTTSGSSGNAIQSNGFRGIVQFGPGEFDVSGHIT